MTIRFALLGAGRIGKVHADAVKSNAQAELAAVFDPFKDAETAIAEGYGATPMSLDEIAASDDIDAVLICTPTNTHADFIEKYARAGKAIFCEKPIDLSLARVQSCLAVVEETKANLMVGFNRRFDPHFGAARRAIETGQIGEVEQVVITSRDPGLPPLDYIDVSGGIFRDMTIHDFDMARFLLGEEIESVFATGSVLVDQAVGEHGDFDSAMVIMRTASGKLAQINNSRRATYGYDQRAEVHGSKGMVAVQNPKPILIESANGAGYQTEPLHDFFMTRYTEAYSAEIKTMIDALVDGAPLAPTGQDGLIALALADAANLSVKEKRMVNMSEVLG